MYIECTCDRHVLTAAHRESIIRIIYQPTYSRKGGELVIDRSGGRYISIGSDGIITFWTVDMQVRGSCRRCSFCMSSFIGELWYCTWRDYTYSYIVSLSTRLNGVQPSQGLFC